MVSEPSQPPIDQSSQSSPDRDEEKCRINRFFTRQGTSSRREADRLIQAGRVTINARVATLGDRVGPNDTVALDGIEIPWRTPSVYLKYHKPVGITTTTEPHIPGNIIAAVGYPERIFPIGRLDKDSSGLILLTNDGDIVNQILRTEFGHEREYIVDLGRPYDSTFLQRMAEGVMVQGRNTKPCTVHSTGHQQFRITLTEGRNRQIRRMCSELGHRVVKLHRIRIMKIRLGGLSQGEWEHLNPEELAGLLSALHSHETDKSSINGCVAGDSETGKS